MNGEYRLGWREWSWGRQPTQSQADLEKWTSATVPPELPASTNEYLYSAFDSPPHASVRLVRRSWLIIAAGAGALAVGLIALYTNLGRTAGFWLAAIIAAVGDARRLPRSRHPAGASDLPRRGVHDRLARHPLAARRRSRPAQARNRRRPVRSPASPPRSHGWPNGRRIRPPSSRPSVRRATSARRRHERDVDSSLRSPGLRSTGRRTARLSLSAPCVCGRRRKHDRRLQRRLPSPTRRRCNTVASSSPPTAPPNGQPAAPQYLPIERAEFERLVQQTEERRQLSRSAGRNSPPPTTPPGSRKATCSRGVATFDLQRH